MALTSHGSGNRRSARFSGSSTSGSALQQRHRMTDRTSPELLPRRLFSSSDDEEEFSMSYGGSSVDISPPLSMKKPGLVGTATAVEPCAMDDVTFKELLEELRMMAKKTLDEDEWKYRPADEILGFVKK